MSKIKKSDHFYLIDGSGYIFRAYYALPPLSRKSDGLPTGAVSGFCSMLFKLLEESRSDDSEEIAIKRYETYEKSSAPVLDYYKQSNLLKVVNGEATIAKINSEISGLIEGIKG